MFIIVEHGIQQELRELDLLQPTALDALQGDGQQPPILTLRLRERPSQLYGHEQVRGSPSTHLPGDLEFEASVLRRIGLQGHGTLNRQRDTHAEALH